MTLPTSLVQAAQRAIETTSPALRDPAALRDRPKPQLRRYEVSTLLPNGDVAQDHVIGPALPIFEDAFCAFSRGALLDTPMGKVAIEDLVPGDEVITATGEVRPVMWKGSTTLVPGRPGPQGRRMGLTRLMADSFGMERPSACVVAGPSARLLHTPAHLRGAGHARVLTPVQDFTDGSTVIETAPPTPVELFHLCLDRHAIIRVADLEFETYHPGKDAALSLSHTMRPVFLGLFAHVDSFENFGPLAFPRADEQDDDAISA